MLNQDDVAADQTPDGEALNLDHIAHWVPDNDAAGRALNGLGFSVTPYSVQTNRSAPDAAPTPAGAGNRCVMLERGYLEFLSPTHPTEVGREIQAGIDRYVGVHLLAFGTRDAQRVHQRLNDAGLAQRPLVNLSRRIENDAGIEETARFTVARALPETMPEGRVQCLTHHTPRLLWQTRYLAHSNGVQGLSAVVVVVADIDEAVARYAPYLSCEPTAVSIGVACRLGRGTLILTDPPTIERRLAIQIPSLPFIAGYALDCLSLGGTTRALLAGGCVSVDGDLPNTQCLAWPGALGGYVLVSEGAEIS